MNILFLCTGNSCRSIMAEALFRTLAPQGVVGQSAGSRPAGYIHPQALATLTRQGISVDGFRSKSWDELTEKPDIVLSLCGNAAGETCPVFFGDFVRSHWGMPDPAHATGDDAAIQAVFDDTFRVLHRRLSALAALPLSTLINDRNELQRQLDKIGTS